MEPLTDGDDGIDPAALADADLDRELARLHFSRHDTFLHASASALTHHSDRTAELEAEYLRRHPDRDVQAQRLRSGARARGGRIRP